MAQIYLKKSLHEDVIRLGPDIKVEDFVHDAVVEKLEKIRGKKIKTIIKTPNGMISCFDEIGNQMPAYQGPYKEVRSKLKAVISRDDLVKLDINDQCKVML